MGTGRFTIHLRLAVTKIPTKLWNAFFTTFGEDIMNIYELSKLPRHPSRHIYIKQTFVFHNMRLLDIKNISFQIKLQHKGCRITLDLGQNDHISPLGGKVTLPPFLHLLTADNPNVFAPRPLERRPPELRRPWRSKVDRLMNKWRGLNRRK